MEHSLVVEAGTLAVEADTLAVEAGTLEVEGVHILGKVEAVPLQENNCNDETVVIALNS